MEKYPIKEEWVGNQYGGMEDTNSLSREKYQEGYDQAMQDMARDADRLQYLSDELGYAYACGCKKTMQDFLEKAMEYFKGKPIHHFWVEDFKNYMEEEL